MRKEIDERHAWLLETARSSKGVSAHAHSVKAGPWIHFLHDAAGTGVNEKLGYGWRGWLYWLSDFSLCNALMGGVLTPHAWRLFNGRRKKWDGARDAIIQVSEEVNRMKKVSKKPVKNA
jgi:dimethylaniline monooxygenase (N-oxide forming)